MTKTAASVSHALFTGPPRAGVVMVMVLRARCIFNPRPTERI
jgi:hypothetical protein